MTEIEVKEIIDFVNKCDKDFLADIYNFDNVKKARFYLKLIKKNNENQKNAIYRALLDKLNIIIKQISSYCSNTLNLINGKNSLSEYIICLIKEKHLTDPKLIARCAYIELSKYVYYDISYTRTTDLDIKRIIVDTPIETKTAKIFSYVVCTQWLQLYKYILFHFGMDVKEIRRPFEDHTWGEVDLNNGEIIIVDATDYIDSSIDLSNAKSVSPTRGFLILPASYSGIRFQEVYTNKNFKNILNEIKKFYEINRELDISLGYIDSYEYPIEKILKEKTIFSRSDEIIQSQQEANKLIAKVQKFLSGIHIPNNMDGYEIFAYYHMFIKNLPINIRGNISMKTLYVDTFEYKQKRLRRKYLHPDEEYLRYLQELIYNRYYKYLNDNESNEIFSCVRNGLINNEQLSTEILNQELKIAEINKRLNPYYAINELIIYNPFGLESHDLYQLYEPSIGKKVFKSSEEEYKYKKLNKIL